MGHRLSLQPDSKCFHLHGHSWWVELEIAGDVDNKGMILNFADVKGPWREYLDTKFDHHMVLNNTDPLAELLYDVSNDHNLMRQWGIQLLTVDPTVENMARIWGEHAREMFSVSTMNRYFRVKVQEAATNMATWEG